MNLRSVIVSALLGVSFVFSTAAQNQEKVTYSTTRLADMVSVKVPDHYRKLNDDQMADKVIASRKPLAMYSSPSGQADFSVSLGNSARNPWQDKDLKMMSDFQRANIKALFTSVTFIQDKIVKINGHDFALFEFISEVKEKTKPAIKKYNYVLYAIKKKNVLIFSFVCNEPERPLQEEVAEQIMKSIRF